VRQHPAPRMLTSHGHRRAVAIETMRQ
jgi:hypothetical protein